VSLVATSADVDALLPGTSTAVDAYGATVLDEFLALAAAGTEGSATFWGSGANYARAQALRCLHLLARAGMLAQANVEDPGESGAPSARSQGGGNSMSFATAQGTTDSLGSTKWGRLLLELQQARLARAWPAVVSTGY
jgi:hypothetical protein